MKKQLKLIRQVDLLKSIELAEIESYLADGSCTVTRYEKNNIVHFAGEVCAKLEIILSGRVVIDRIDEAGNLMTIAEFLSGDVLGGNLMFSKSPFYPMTVTAKETTVILAVDRDLLLLLFSKNHEFLRRYLAYVSDHTAILGDRIKHYVNRTIRESVISFLDYEHKKQNANPIQLSMTKKALAERIGVQRTSLSRELAKMREEGLIDFNAGSITLLHKFFGRKT